VVVERAYAERVFRKENYEALRRAHEKTDRTIGNLLNKLVVDYLQDLVTKEEKAALRSPLRRERF
jgi:oligoendopeptidase F